MSSDPQKLPRKRPADSDIISDEDENVERDRSGDFKIKTLDEILLEKRRRTENEDSIKAEGQTSGKSSRNASPVVTSRRDSKGSSKHNSPVEGEVIYQLSPEQISLSSGSPGETPSKVKHPLSHDGEMEIRLKRGRKATEEEEGEIVSDHSDTEGKKVEKQRRSSAAAVDENFTNSKQQVTEVSEAKTSKDPVEEADNSEETTEGEDDVETQAATKRVRKEGKEEVVEKEKESHSEAEESSSEEESEDDDDDDDDEEEEDDDDDEEMEKEEKSNYNDYRKQKGGEMKPVRSEEQAKDNVRQGEEESSSEEEESSEEGSDKEESESESETSDESEEEKMKIKEQKVTVSKTNQKEDTMESEDLHKELQQLNKRHKERDERYKHKTYPEQQQLEKRVDRRRDQRSVDYRTERKEKVYEKEKRSHDSRTDKSYFQSDPKSRPHEKRGHSGNQISVQEKGSWSKHHKSSTSSKETVKSENLRQREKHEVVREKEKKSSRKDTGKHSPPMDNRGQTKSKERKNSNRGNRKDETSGKRSHEKKTSSQSSVSRKAGQDEGTSLVLTEQERRQFTNEVVDLESEDSSIEDDKHFDSGVKHKERSPEEVYNEDEEDGEIKLPAYYPAVRGCRNVEEFQWLNRIEEGTYGVVYRAKDKKTGDIVALKKLKMEREKEGFPITSLREINTLLKGQHPNIVTVREIVVGSNMDKIYIVMDYVEHDLKVLMEHMTEGFTIGEVKTLMIQLLRAVSHLHDNWILHRDIKASNLLLSNKGILKVGDFGLAREYGSPLKNYTPIVVTLWYRAPELLLGTKMYSTPIDLWSVGCVFAELLTMKPLFPGKSEIDQINRIFKELGTPSDTIWPGPPSYSELPAVQKMTFVDYPYNSLRNRFGAFLTDKGFDLLNRFLTYDPGKRITAEEALKHEYLFSESPKPVDPSMFPTWPAKSEMMKRPKKKEYEHSPQAPQGGAMFAKLADEGDSGSGSQGTGFHMPTSQKGSAAVVGFKLKF